MQRTIASLALGLLVALLVLPAATSLVGDADPACGCLPSACFCLHGSGHGSHHTPSSEEGCASWTRCPHGPDDHERAVTSLPVGELLRPTGLVRPAPSGSGVAIPPRLHSDVILLDELPPPRL